MRARKVTPEMIDQLLREHVREDEPVSQFNPSVFWCKECDYQFPCPTVALVAAYLEARG